MIEFLSTTTGACLFAVFCWWLGTGAILWLVRLPTSTFRWSMFFLSFLLGLSLWTTSISMRSHSVLNAYIGFVSVIAMWSWHEMAFLTGWLAGPRRVALDPGLSLNRRFGQSVMALLYHEVALLFNFGVLLALQQGREFILCGDINIAHKEADLKNWRGNKKNSGFLPEEREWMTKLTTEGGLVDVYRQLHPDTTDACYTWWSNRGQAYANNVGWRLDYHLATPALAANAKTVTIYKDEKFSDHAPVTVAYDMVM